MTANKHFKRRVRERALRTGESYTAALRHLRRIDAQEHLVQWQRIEKPDFGYAVHVPQGWDERPPNLKNSPWETARFGDPTDRRHTVIVFRSMARLGWTAAEVAEGTQTSLQAADFGEFHIIDAQIAGQTGVAAHRRYGNRPLPHRWRRGLDLSCEGRGGECGAAPRRTCIPDHRGHRDVRASREIPGNGAILRYTPAGAHH
ncbi:hypothetical protein DKM19_13345 [Streptosporangium sp. 'caverna']|nr:hypothetical protein DKM19_13345 [Streptosporangium sp. 'caverna']